MSRASGNVVVTAAGSGAGKTLVTLALCAALRERGVRVQPYKIGPDYIDARFYARVAGRVAYNVDLWLDGEAGVRAHVAATRGAADVALFEGMMGAYDGANDGSGSTAAVARTLDARTIAVIDCWAASQTAAAVAVGLRAFDPALDFAGVILNRIAGDEHERAVRDACERADVPVLAVVRYDPSLEAADRRLGLDVAAVERRAAAVDILARSLATDSELMRWFGAVRSARRPSPSENAGTIADAQRGETSRALRPRIAFAQDDAFWFTYPETLEALCVAGAEPVPFSPLRDRTLPAGTDGIWIGGGYPETHARELQENVTMRASIASACAAGRPTYGECGGLMYLAERLTTERGTFAMVGALRGATSIAQPRLQIGYRDARASVDTPLDRAGDALRAYEFHYAAAALEEPVGAYEIAGGLRDGAATERVVAGFLHRHFLPGSAPIARFVAACAAKEPS